jgi:hypothetical protein
MIESRIEAQNIREIVKELKNVDPAMFKELKAELKTAIEPFSKQVRSAIPDAAPLSGMSGEYPSAWSSVRMTTSFTPGRSKKTGKLLVTLRVTPLRGRYGFILGEIAGSKSSGVTASGRRMIEKLNMRKPMRGKGGRYAYNQFRMIRPDAVKAALRALQKGSEKINRQIEMR